MQIRNPFKFLAPDFLFNCTRQLFVISLLVVSCFTNIQAQNFALIQPADDEAKIIRKAATLAPMPRQLRWQQLELTGFFHFGINTFTNRGRIVYAGLRQMLINQPTSDPRMALIQKYQRI